MSDPNEPQGQGDWSDPIPEEPTPSPEPAMGQPPGAGPQPEYPPPPPPPGYGAPPPRPGQQINNFMIPAVLSILCFWPISIVAIVFASQVNSKLRAGDVAGAQEAAKKAKMWTFISVGVGIVAIIILAGSGGFDTSTA